MTPEEAAERYDVHVSHADNGDHVTAADGTELVVLVSARDGERRVVHADVVDYGSGLDHPLASGAAGFTAMLAALVVPLGVTLYAALTASSMAATIGITLVGTLVAWYAASVAMNRTVVGDWLFRFLEWNDHRTLIEARGRDA